MDVERTLGPPDRNIDNQQLTYYSDDVVVVFGFAGNAKCQQRLPHTSWDVTSDTVTAIDVSLRHPPLLSETGIDLAKFKKIKADYDLVGRYYYLSPDDDGFAIEVGDKYVMGYHYAPGSKHKDLRCDANKPH